MAAFFCQRGKPGRCRSCESARLKRIGPIDFKATDIPAAGLADDLAGQKHPPGAHKLPSGRIIENGKET
jgi:hypothetical protein